MRDMAFSMLRPFFRYKNNIRKVKIRTKLVILFSNKKDRRIKHKHSSDYQ